jgi:hypothetical protein
MTIDRSFTATWALVLMYSKLVNNDEAAASRANRTY